MTVDVWPLSRADDPVPAGKLHWIGGGCAECDENAAASPIGYDDEWPNPGPPVHAHCDCEVEWVPDEEEDRGAVPMFDNLAARAADFAEQDGTIAEVADLEQAMAIAEDVNNMYEMLGGEEALSAAETTGYDFTRYALDMASEDGVTVFVAQAEDVGYAGAISVEEREGLAYVAYLGSTGTVDGTGSALTQQVAKWAAERDLTVAGRPTDEALSFWRDKMGWTEDPLGRGDDVWGWTVKQTEAVAEMNSAALVEALEPELSIGDALESIPATAKGAKAWAEANGQFGQDYLEASRMWSLDTRNSKAIRAALSGTYGSGAPGTSSAEIRAAAETFARALDHAPVVNEELYRVAMYPTKAFEDTFAKGGELKLNPSSFSYSKTAAQRFGVAPGPGDFTRVMLRVKGARGLPISGLSHSVNEKEVISSGKFVVQSVKQAGNVNVAGGGRWEVVLEQVR